MFVCFCHGDDRSADGSLSLRSPPLVGSGRGVRVGSRLYYLLDGCCPISDHLLLGEQGALQYISHETSASEANLYGDALQPGVTCFKYMSFDQYEVKCH